MRTNPIPKPILEHLEEGITKALKESISEKYDVLKNKFVEQLERDKDKEIAAIAINLSSQINISDLGRTLTISIKKEDVADMHTKTHDR